MEKEIKRTEDIPKPELTSYKERLFYAIAQQLERIADQLENLTNKK